MYLTVKQQLKHLSKEDYENLRSLCHTAKTLQIRRFTVVGNIFSTNINISAMRRFMPNSSLVTTTN